MAGTFWAAHPPDYGLLAPCAAQAEELFQVLGLLTTPSTGIPFKQRACRGALPGAGLVQ